MAQVRRHAKIPAEWEPLYQDIYWIMVSLGLTPDGESLKPRKGVLQFDTYACQYFDLDTLKRELGTLGWPDRSFRIHFNPISSSFEFSFEIGKFESTLTTWHQRLQLRFFKLTALVLIIICLYLLLTSSLFKETLYSAFSVTPVAEQ